MTGNIDRGQVVNGFTVKMLYFTIGYPHAKGVKFEPCLTPYKKSLKMDQRPKWKT